MNALLKGSFMSLALIIAIPNIASCNYEDSGMKLVRLSSGEGQSYEIEVPKGYFRSSQEERAVELRTVFPSMEQYTGKNKHKFFRENGSMRDEVVRIFLSLNNAPVLENYSFTNRNDRGAFLYHNVLRTKFFKSSPVDAELANHDITKFVPTEGPKERTAYVVNYKQILTVIQCANACKAYTTIDGKIGVLYLFGQAIFHQVYEINSAVLKLLNSLKIEPK